MKKIIFLLATTVALSAHAAKDESASGCEKTVLEAVNTVAQLSWGKAVEGTAPKVRTSRYSDKIWRYVYEVDMLNVNNERRGDSYQVYVTTGANPGHCTITNLRTDFPVLRRSTKKV